MITLGGWALANPAGLLWCLLALPIIALHILRPRRVQAQVAAIFLWRRVATPVSAARPWQRLTPSWLLLAQVLTALLLGLLMARPVQLTDQLLAEHTIFVIDASASMQANDGSPDRLADATARASELRGQVPASGEASLIVAGSEARALLTASPDADAFDKALHTIEASDGHGDFASAFTLAAGLDTADTESRVVFISDGGIGADDLRAAPVGTQYEQVGTSATNRGITQLSVEPAESGLVARVSVTSFGGPPATQTLRIDVDGVTSTAQEVSLDTGEVVNLTIPVPAGTMIEAFLEGEDALAVDNRAVATTSRRPAVQVLLAGPTDTYLEAALGASPGVELSRTETVPAPDEIDPAIDLVVANKVDVPSDLTLPVLAVAPPGGARGITPTAGGTVEQPVLTLVRSDVPLVQDLDLSGVFIAEAQRLDVPTGAEVVLGAEGAPLLVAVESPAPTIYLGFDLAQSTLPLELAFPVLVDRAMSDLTDLVTPPPRLTVGADLPINPQLEATVTSPDLTSETIPPGSSYPSADRIGFWRITQDERPEVLIAVGPDRRESAVAPAPDLPFEAAFEGTGPAPAPGEIPYLYPVVLVLLALLVAEYLLARRRRGVGPRQWRLATGLRVAVALALLAVLLAPGFNRSASEVATVFVIDASDSMTAAGRSTAVGVAREALTAQPDDTRAGVVVFGSDARLETLVSGDPAFDGVTVQVDPGGTDLAAALRLGAAALPGDARRRIVLVSDGRATTGDVAAEADRLTDEGVPVDVVVVEPPTGTDLAVAGIDVPSLARNGDQIDIDVQVAAPLAGPAEVVLRRDGEEIDRQTVDLEAGENTVRFSDVASDDGVLRYQAEVLSAGDAVSANNLGFAAVPVEGADRVLVAEGTTSNAEGLVASLEASGLTVDAVPAGSLPAIDELTRYSSVVLVDVDRRDLSDGQVQALTGAVRDLGRGMLVIGGTQSYALGGYRDTDLEEILPVVSEITDPLRRQTVAEVLAIDTSGSMGACHCDEEGMNGLGGGNRIGGGVSKTSIARSAAAQAIAALEATDEVGVLTMDANDRWVIDLQQSPPQDVIDEGLNQLAPDGPTFVDSGLLTAAEALRESDASLKHIIFFSDGFTEPGVLADVADQAADLFAEGITVSVVATGEGAAEDLQPIADAGGGRFYPGRNLEQIPELIVSEAVLASRDFVNEGEFLPTITSSRAPVQELTESPPLLGYVATSPKPTATVDLQIGPDNDPLLASWRAGLGRVTAWTSDAGTRWAASWDSWAAAPDFWAATVKDTFPVAGTGGGVTAQVTDGQLDLRVEGADDWPDDAAATARVAAPDGTSIEVPLERIDGSTFAGSTAVDEAGTYAVGATVTDGSETVWAGVGLGTRSYPAEYAPVPVATDQLARIADQTDGRVDPPTDDLFAEIGTVAGTKRYDLTRWLLLFAVLAWPVAVALSRLSWRRGLLAVGAGRATDTLSQLRDRLPKMTEPRLPATTDGDASPSPPAVAPNPQPAAPATRPATIVQRPKPTKPTTAAAPTDRSDHGTGADTADPGDDADKDEAETSTLAALLAARKRRRS